ncbi:MAG: hypothetical protein IT386_12880 [Deltaproteobacteria bacterium]|nr:hypothetical protein [Deltaproteobacteria bacterium]
MTAIRRFTGMLIACCTISAPASATFTAFNGALPEEALWQAAAAPTALEDFESYSGGTQISSLSSLNLTFDELAGGGHPQAYGFSGTPYGPMQLGNFPNGVNETNRWNDIVARPAPGSVLQAMGFWNGDGQADTLFAFAYDASGALLGSVGALQGTFAGFVSDTPVAWVTFDGNTGDGWNHLDGLQVGAIPEPATALLVLCGLGTLAGVARRTR